MTKTKLVEIEITGREIVTHIRRAIIEVPVEMTLEAMCQLETEDFDHLDQRTDWEADDSEGISSEGTAYFIGLAPAGAEPEAVVVGNDDCGYRVIAKESLRK